MTVKSSPGFQVNDERVLFESRCRVGFGDPSDFAERQTPELAQNGDHRFLAASIRFLNDLDFA